MCIFSQPVTSVSRTRIFARKSSAIAQFLVYQMNYESPQATAMILPIPVKQPAQDRSFRFVDLKHYPNFFDDLARGFPFNSSASFSIGCSLPSDPLAEKKLKIFKVGNYVASFVPTLQDFSRLDDQFRLPDTLSSPSSLYQDFGFAVFQLAEGSLEPHPMAFEFETSNSGLFFPTLHIHDGTIQPEEEFDHALYLQHAGFDSQVYGYRNNDFEDTATRWIRSKYTADCFCRCADTDGLVKQNLLVHRKLIVGKHTNQDTVVELFGDSQTPELNLRPLLNSVINLPWWFFSCAVIWIFLRRDRVKRDAQTKQKPA